MINILSIIRESLDTNLNSIILELETKYGFTLIDSTINAMIRGGELISINRGLYSVKVIQEEIMYLIGSQIMTRKNLIAVVSIDLRIDSRKVNHTTIEVLINNMIKKDWLINTPGDPNAFEENLSDLYKINSLKFHTLPEYEE